MGVFFKLKDYQELIAKRIDQRFRPDDDGIHTPKKFAGVILPTGGGKSYLFMDQLNKVIDENNNNDQNIPDDIISDVKVRYFTPTRGIVSQTNINIIKSIVFDRLYDKYKSEDLKETVTNMGERLAKDCISKTAKTGKAKKDYERYVEIINGLYDKYSSLDSSMEDKVKSIFNDFLIEAKNDLNRIMENELPNVKVVCYDDITKLNPSEVDEDTKLVVDDEAHKAVADETDEKMRELMKKLKDAKFLAITATPTRDVDGVDSIEKMAIYSSKISSDYSLRELREKDYLASNMTLVEALEEGLVVKPEVISFDCLLDQTKEYKEVFDWLKANKKKQFDSIGVNIYTGQVTSNYHKVMLDFFKMCKITGKFDFLKDYLSKNQEDSSVLDNYLSNLEENKFSSDDIRKYEALLTKIEEIDNAETEIGKSYEEWRNNKVGEIINNARNVRPYLNQGKHICFTPTSGKKSETKGIMYGFKQKMMDILNLKDDDVLITHGNTEVISAKEDKENLEKFMLLPERGDHPTVMVAMNKFNEGLHVDGVVALHMNRPIREDSTSEKEDPKIVFLQQIGRAIFSIKKGEPVKEPPIIFDYACNFMRFNERLNNMFNISDNQTEFKRLFEDYKVCKTKQNDKEDDHKIPDENIISRVLGVMEALKEHEIDFTDIDKDTKWADIAKKIPEDKLSSVLDSIYANSKMRIKDDYSFGRYVISSRNAFWHRVRKNQESSGIKTCFNSATDKFFEECSVEYLNNIGFFDDRETLKEEGKVDELDFIVGECAKYNDNYGINLETGGRYTKFIPERGILSVDVNRFSKERF